MSQPIFPITMPKWGIEMQEGTITAWNVAPGQVAARSLHSRAFIAVQTGCDHACTFCVIPQGRGVSRSVTLSNVVQRVARHLAEGAKEVVLTGVDLTSWGNDYDTPDGTGVRDYLHVVDLAVGHVKALERLERHKECIAINLGTGTGCSVLDMVWAFEKASGQSVPFKIGARRPGDVAACYADPGQALVLLGWRAERDLQAMCADAWRWQCSNPAGYAPATANA